MKALSVTLEGYPFGYGYESDLRSGSWLFRVTIMANRLFHESFHAFISYRGEPFGG